LGLSFTSTSVAVGVSSKPEIMDPDPHGAEKGREPLTLLVCHGTMVSGAVLGLEIAPFFGEFSAEEVGPADGTLLLEETLVSRRVWCRIKGLISKVAEEAFVKDVLKDRVQKGVKGVE
jgi:hypothetical protein